MPRKRPPKTNGEAHAVADPFPDRTGQSPPATATPPLPLPASKQLRPTITFFASGSSYVLRLEDIRFTAMALAIAREIRSGSLIVITPTDTKVFDMGSSIPEAPVPADRNTSTTADIPVEFQEYVQGEPEVEEEPAPIIEPEFQETHVRHREHTPAPDNSLCGRCQGTGHTLAGGGCPVCGGRGTIIAWGRGSRQ